MKYSEMKKKKKYMIEAEKKEYNNIDNNSKPDKIDIHSIIKKIMNLNKSKERKLKYFYI